ncbi:MAG: DUF58 domain-containing protein [Clostridiales bacterium]|nr:DUF58 domain-containing protein [Clostridiales bacterium]
MLYRRIVYGGVLVGVFLFQITNESYMAHFLLALCLAMPLLSLALSLPGMLGCRLSLSADPAVLERGEAGQWRLSVGAPAGLPLARVALRLTEKNLLTNETKSRRLTMTGVARRKPVELSAPTGHCGLLELRADKARVYDYLGLFSRRLETPPPARLLCRPIPEAAEPPSIPEGQGSHSPSSAARRGPGEDYDLREYRPGDPMRSVHWKLSSKWDELIVRERADTMVPLPLLTLDRFGTPEALDRLLDKLLGLSRALLEIQRPHAVLWLDGAGEPQLCAISDEREYAVCVLALLSAPAPLTGPCLDDRPELLRGPGGPVFRIHVDRSGGEGHG